MNIKFTIAYKGTNYHGWQMQKNALTIQGELHRAFRILLPSQSINIIGSGRTDAGVHAYNQIASITLPDNLDLNKFFNSANGIINNDIYIKSFEEVSDDFHARFSATLRSYKYHINTQYSPFKKHTSWFVNHQIDVDVLNECANNLLGEHNFSLLSKHNTEVKNKVCIIYESFWQQSKNDLIYHIKANRFLYHMVRFIVGTSIEVSKSNFLFNNFMDLVNNKTTSKNAICAPAQGLFLSEVNYE
tara:strand:+ start:7138 stop:7869 length:732 start_codon:yes stop_codon:yes gene_type:complete